MKHFVSMTNTLKGVMKGDIDILDLQGATFHFGCAKEHFDIGVPHEATWCNVELPVIYGSDQLNAAVDPVTSTLALEAVDEEFREKVMEFLSCVRAADAKGRVNYRIGNYPRYEAQLARDLTVSAAEGFLQPEILADAKIYTSRGEWSSFVVILKEAEADGTLESLRIAAKANPPFRSVTLTLSPDGESVEQTPGPPVEGTMAEFAQEQLGWKVDIRDSDDDDDQPPHDHDAEIDF